jgi:hypothetical protein
VQQLAKEYRVTAITETNESWGHVNVFLTDAMQNDKQSGKTIRRVIRNSVENGEAKLGPDEPMPDDAEEMGHILVLASGNLGLVYSTRQQRRVTMEEIETVFLGLLNGLVQHEGIGWVMVHSAEHGPVVIGARRRLP